MEIPGSPVNRCKTEYNGNRCFGAEVQGWLYAEPLAVCAHIFSARHACFILKDFALLVRLR